jgi:hypothetical protein
MRVGGYDPLEDKELVAELQATNSGQARALLVAAVASAAKGTAPSSRHLDTARTQEEQEGLPALVDLASARERAASGKAHYLFFHNVMYSPRVPLPETQAAFLSEVTEHKRMLAAAAMARGVANVDPDGDIRSLIASEDDMVTTPKPYQAGDERGQDLFGELRFGFDISSGKRYVRYPSVKIQVTLKKNSQDPQVQKTEEEKKAEEASRRVIDLPAEVSVDTDVDFLLTSAWN